MNMTLIGFNTCPYVHRIRLLLEAARQPYSFTVLNPHIDKPKWFTQLSPTGKVPLIDINGRILCETTAIVEYLNDHFENVFLPSDIWQRAHYRSLISRAEELLASLWKMYNADTESDFLDETTHFNHLMARHDNDLKPYASDLTMKLCALSCTYAPVFYKYQRLESYLQRSLYPRSSKLSQWQHKVLSLPCFKATIGASYHAENKVFVASFDSYLGNIVKTQV